MPSQNYLKFRPNFGIADLERTVAEEDPNLSQYYIGRDQYVARAVDRDDPASIFIGPKGVGKSAVLQMVRSHAFSSGNKNRVIEIAPDDLAFNALINIDSRTPLLGSASQNQWLFTSLWDYVLCVEVLHRETADDGALGKLITSLVGNKNRREQEKLLKITLDDEGRHSTMTDKMLALVKAIEVEGEYNGGKASATMHLTEPTDRSDDLKLLQLINNVAKNLPKSLTREYYILIDDLDLHWSGTALQNTFLASMFLSIRKLSRSPAIKFVVSLRKSIYREINLEERDKFSGQVCDVHWGKAAVMQMVEARLSFALAVPRRDIWKKVFPARAFDHLWNNTNGMPREVLRLAVSCIKQAIADGDGAVTESAINMATPEFSVERRDELASLFQFQYPRLHLVTRQFSGGHKEFDIDAIQDIGLRMSDLVDKNPTLTELDWATSGFEDPIALARALLTCEFLLLKDGRSGSARIANDEEIQLLDEEKWFAVHPMYHAGLELNGFDRFSGSHAELKS